MNIEEKLRICNAVNEAIAHGKTVRIGKTILQNPLFMRGNRMVTAVSSPEHPSYYYITSYSEENRIVILDESKVIYDPNNVDTLT